MGSKLEPLDPKKLGEDVEVEEIKLRKPKRCKHFFEYVRANEIKCQKCHFGLFIGPGERLKDGHLYKGETKII